MKIIVNNPHNSHLIRKNLTPVYLIPIASKPLKYKDFANKSTYIIIKKVKKIIPHCRVLSMNWGPWDSGMVTSQLKEVLLEKNIPIISSDYGPDILLNEINLNHQPPVQVLIGSQLPDNNSFLSETGYDRSPLKATG